MESLNSLKVELAEKTKQFKEMEKQSGGYIHEGLRHLYKSITKIKERIDELEFELICK